MLPRVLSLDQRIKNSELFPRIRDAEKEMILNEKEFQRKRKKLLNLKKKKDNTNTKDLLQTSNNFTILQPIEQRQYFNAYTLNKDPSCSKYMPFDKVYFPKLFNHKHIIEKTSPDTLDSLWMLGFEDYLHRSVEDKKNIIAKPDIKN